MVAAKIKAITGMPKQQYNYKKLQNKEEGLSQLLESNLSLLVRQWNPISLRFHQQRIHISDRTICANFIASFLSSH